MHEKAKTQKRRRTMNVKHGAGIVLMGFLMVIGSVFSATAQEKPADNMQIVLEKIRADKKLFVAENMQLTEAEAKAFWPVYEKYQDELFLIRVRTAKLINDYADVYEKMTNAAAKKLLDEYMNIESLGLKLRQAYLVKFRNVMPEVKVARYYQMENKINAGLVYELATKIPLTKMAK
jgi:hypothetical protein